ncbi:MAG: MlaD family protein [Planctomycetota bacterium]
MAELKRMEILIGAFVLAAVIAIAGMILVFGGADNPFVTKFEVDIVFNHIGDLQTGAPVKLGGVRVGKIAEIKLQETGNIRVSATIDEDTPLRIDTKAQIATSGIVGDTFVEFIAGKKPESFPTDKSIEIDGTGQVGLNEILTQVNVIGAEVTSLVNNINDIIGKENFKDNIRATVQNTADATKRAEELLADLKKTSENIFKASEDVLSTTGMVSGMAVEIKEAVVSKKNLQKINDTLSNVKVASSNTTEMTHHLKNILARSDKLLKEEDPRLRKSVENIEMITRELRNKLASISTDKGVLRYFTQDDINQKIDSIFKTIDQPLKKISAMLSTMSKLDLMKAYAQGSRLAKYRERELNRMGKDTVREMLDEEYKEEQKAIRNRTILQDLQEKE